MSRCKQVRSPRHHRRHHPRRCRTAENATSQMNG
jgi:hypothetical protein